MRVDQITVIILIKSALTGEKYPLPEGAVLRDVFKIAVKHNIANIVYYGAVNCGVDASSVEMLQLFQYVCKFLALGERQMYEINNICRMFDENEIKYMPLKGTVLKALYPKADMRTMGDADILIKMEQYEKIKRIMENQNFRFVKDNVNEIVWNKAGVLYLELHRYLVAPAHKDLFRLFGDGWKMAHPCESGGNRYEMSPEDTFLFLVIHFAKHYRSGGIGIRQVVDLWVYRRNYCALDEEYIKQKLTTLKMYDFYKNICEMLEVWFENRKPSEMSEFLTCYIFESGNFGTKDNYAAANIVRESKTSGSIKKSFFRRVITSVFLPYASMCKKYAFLKKAPILLPAMWIVRAVDSIVFKKKSIKDYNIDTATLEKANKFEQELEYVGLNFDFDDND